MRRAFLTTMILGASLLGSGCVRPSGSSSGNQSRQPDSQPRYQVGMFVGEENTAFVEALLHGRIVSNGFEPPERWSVRWGLGPLFGLAEGPIDANSGYRR